MTATIISKKSEKLEKSESTVITQVVERVPIFEIASFTIRSHNLKVFDLEKKQKFGAWEIPTGVTTLLYDYDSEVTIFFEVPELKRINDITLEVVTYPTIRSEAKCFNYHYIACTSTGLTYNTIPFTDIFDAINSGVEDAREDAMNLENTKLALDHFKEQYSKMYAAIGFNLIWK
jgi:hypothetical protein